MTTSPNAEARRIHARIEREFENHRSVFDRIDKDWDLYTLEQWHPAEEEPIAPEDAYTTNKPRVLANKIISFIANTEALISVRNDFAQKPQEDINENTEQLAIGMLENANRRLHRNSDPSIQDQLASFSVLRGRYAAARAMLVKQFDGTTREDILPLDPRHLVIWRGDGEPSASAYRMFMKRNEIDEKYPRFYTRPEKAEFSEESWRESIPVYEYISSEENPDYDEFSENPFARRRRRYMVSTIVEDRYARRPHDTFTRMFPLRAMPIDPMPQISPTDAEDDPLEHFGESIFAENRHIWDKTNRITSYLIDMTAKGSNPRQLMTSRDGTTELEDGSQEKGATVSLSSANDEALEVMREADANRAIQILSGALNVDEVGGSIPPQSIGLLDKPLSSVALRQLGQNLEQKVLARMKGVAQCIEGCLEIMVDQYETGAFEPITVSGRRYDSARFANRQITPEEIQGHDPIMVTMELSLPEDDSVRWTLAQQAMTPTVTGEPLASLEWTREHILRMQSSKQISMQNREILARQASPVVQLTDLLQAALRDGDETTAAALYDRLRIAVLQEQVQGSLQMFQLQQIAAGIPPQTAVQQGFADNVVRNNTDSLSGQQRNPAFGAVPDVQFRTNGNQPSPEAGFNTTASRDRGSRPTGLVGPDGNELFAGE